jgi:uncharacterized protein YggT (Ycf19 family)
MVAMNKPTQSSLQSKKELPAELAEVTPPIQMRISKVASYALYTWVSIGLVSLGIRVFLLLFSANREAPFVDFIYRLSADYLAPFRGIFPPHSVGETGYLDVAALFAIFIYLIVAWLVTALIKYIQEKIDAHDREERKRIAYEQSVEAGADSAVGERPRKTTATTPQ